MTLCKGLRLYFKLYGEGIFIQFLKYQCIGRNFKSIIIKQQNVTAKTKIINLKNKLKKKPQIAVNRDTTSAPIESAGEKKNKIYILVRFQR